MSDYPPLRFTLEDVNAAHDAWGANCGPAAIAAIAGLTLDEVRPHMGDFESKRYTNPSLMWDATKSVGLHRWWFTCRPGTPDGLLWPVYGLVRIQWEGPWTLPGVPMAARYRHTHWVGARRVKGIVSIFDVNCMSVDGWVPLAEWSEQVVPWLLGECEPKANGKWHITHVMYVDGGWKV